uniref:SJCHGC04768 protein n=1 Tax=Schistosoma japonicum TaxID=6182 RepID=Q5DE43_SCHJA|nr:SJCHGC04768 protein [Schistosoma japonicum]
MEMKMKLMIFLIMLMISIVYTQNGRHTLRPQLNSTHGSQTDKNDRRSQRDRFSDKRSEHSSNHGKNKIRTESMLGTSSSRYQYRKAREFNARGKSRSRGIGKYGTMSSESTDFVVEGKIGKYGRRKPTKSKFKTRGKEKKYSRRINDNRFDIKGGLYERRQHVGIGDYQANGSHIDVMLKTKEKSGSSNGTMIGRDSSSHSNSTQRNERSMWNIF